MQNFDLSDKMIFNGDNGKHEYLIATENGMVTPASVTTLIGKHIGPDQTDSAILDKHIADELAKLPEDASEEDLIRAEELGIERAITHEERRNMAAAMGTEKHKFLEMFMKDDMPEEGDMNLYNFSQKIVTELGISRQSKIKEGESLESWRNRQPENVVYSEVKLCSSKGAVPFAGTADLIFKNERGWGIADYKSNKLDGAYKNYARFQMMMYAKALEENFGIKPTQFYVCSDKADKIIELQPADEKIIDNILSCEKNGEVYAEKATEKILSDTDVNIDELSTAAVKSKWISLQKTDAEAARDTFRNLNAQYNQYVQNPPVKESDPTKYESVKIQDVSVVAVKNKGKLEFDDDAFIKDYKNNPDFQKYITKSVSNETIRHTVKRDVINKLSEYESVQYQSFGEAQTALSYFSKLSTDYRKERKSIPTNIQEKMQEYGLYKLESKYMNTTISGGEEKLSVYKDDKVALQTEHPDVFDKYSYYKEPSSQFTFRCTANKEAVAAFVPNEPDFEKLLDNSKAIQR